MNAAQQMKVFAGSVFVKGEQMLAVIAVTSQRAVADATGHSLHYIRGYWGVTGNPEQVKAALKNPGVLMVRPLYARDTPFRTIGDAKR